ncbi:hypothetical protein DV738_g809, partial [Chaetothyriales sp. CBS 135597]
MASDFIGDTILVTLLHPPKAQIQGVVADVVDQKLHLQNVTLLWSNQHLPSYILPASVIADVEVSASPLPIPADVSTPTAAVPHVSLSHHASQQFVDPAILSYTKPPNQHPGATLAQPVSPVMIADGAVRTPSLPSDRRPQALQGSMARMSTTQAPQPLQPLQPPQVQPLQAQPLQHQQQLPLPHHQPPHRGWEATGILTEPFDGLTLKEDVLQKDNARSRTRRQRHKQTPSQTGPGIIDIKDNNHSLTGLAAKKPAKGKGWRKTPLIEEIPRTTSSRRGRRAEDQNGWATEDATDVQDLGDFDFAANLSKFDKRQVFDDLRRNDHTAYEDRLVSFNRKARPGTNGGRNLHFTENVLDSPDTWRSEAGDTEDDHDKVREDHHSSSRGSKPAGSRKPLQSRKGSLLALRDRTDSPAPLARVANSPINGSLSGIRASFRLPNNKPCHCVSPLQMLEIEQLCTSELGLTEDMLSENAGRSIAEAVLKSGDDVRYVVILAGNHKSGARVIAAARHLRNRRLRVTVVILGGERDDLLQEIVRKQLKIYKTSQGYVDRWDQFKAKIDAGAPTPDIVLDALLGLHISFDELRSDDAAACFEMIKWASRTNRVVSVDVPSGLSAQSGLYTEAEGQMLVMESKQVIALGAPKTGLLHAMALDGSDSSWSVIVADIGISTAAWQKHGSRRRHGIDFGSDWIQQKKKRKELRPQDSSYIQYSITDKLSFFLGAVRSNLVYQSALRKTATGFESFTSPGSGVKIHGTFNLYRSPDMLGVVHFIERNETKCNLFLGVYIKATLASSHKTLHENFKIAWNEALKRKLGAAL